MRRAQGGDVPEVVQGRAAVGPSMLHVRHGGKLAEVCGISDLISQGAYSTE